MGCDALAAHQYPRLHGVGCVEPPAHHEPEGQAAHVTLSPRPLLAVSLVLGEYRPFGQSSGMGATLPSAHLCPASHSLHAVAPSSPWYEPSGQIVHRPLRLAAAYVPLLHAVASSAPATQKAPAGQSWHSLAPFSPGVLLYVPCMHGSGAEAPSSQ